MGGEPAPESDLGEGEDEIDGGDGHGHVADAGVEQNGSDGYKSGDDLVAALEEHGDGVALEAEEDSGEGGGGEGECHRDSVKDEGPADLDDEGVGHLGKDVGDGDGHADGEQGSDGGTDDEQQDGGGGDAVGSGGVGGGVVFGDEFGEGGLDAEVEEVNVGTELQDEDPGVVGAGLELADQDHGEQEGDDGEGPHADEIDGGVADDDARGGEGMGDGHRSGRLAHGQV